MAKRSAVEKRQTAAATKQLSVRLPATLHDRIKRAHHKAIADGAIPTGTQFQDWFADLLERFIPR